MQQAEYSHFSLADDKDLAVGYGGRRVLIAGAVGIAAIRACLLLYSSAAKLLAL